MWNTLPLHVFLKSILFISFFLERGKEKERERNINVWLPLTWPLLGTWPATQASALTGNWTSDPLVRRLAVIHWAIPARADYQNINISDPGWLAQLVGVSFRVHQDCGFDLQSGHIWKSTMNAKISRKTNQSLSFSPSIPVSLKSIKNKIKGIRKEMEQK